MGRMSRCWRSLQAVGVVDDREIGDVVGQGVDREVAAEGVLLRRAEDVVAQDHPVLVLQVAGRAVLVARLLRFFLLGRGQGAEGGNLQDLVLKMEMGQPEATADQTAVAKEPFDLRGRGVRGDVEILGGSAPAAGRGRSHPPDRR